MTTLSWNINGFYNNLQELQYIISQYKPDYICLQESHLQQTKNATLKNFQIYRRDRTTRTHTYGGVAICAHDNNYSEEIQLNTPLEAIAVRITYPEPCTLCSLYLAPDEQITAIDLENLIKSLPRPFIITGDFNAYNTIWNSNHTDPRGRTVEQVINNLVLLNNGKPTHFSAQYGTFSIIDLTLSDPRIATNLEWDTLPSLHGSDHFPVIITNLLSHNQSISTLSTPKWNVKKTDWELYTNEAEKTNLYLHNEIDVDI